MLENVLDLLFKIIPESNFAKNFELKLDIKRPSTYLYE